MVSRRRSGTRHQPRTDGPGTAPRRIRRRGRGPRGGYGHWRSVHRRAGHGAHAGGVRCKLVIDATGRSRALTRLLQKARAGQTSRKARYVAFKNHLEGAAIRPGTCEIYAYPGGYGGCSSIEGDRQNLCFIVPAAIAKRLGSDPQAVMREAVQSNVRARETLGRAAAAETWLAVPVDGYGCAKLAPAPGLLSIGDAAGFIDPFTGSGILMALDSGRLAAETIVRQGLAGNIDAVYTREYGRMFGRRLRTSSLLRSAAFFPLAAELLVRGLSLSEGLTRRLALATRTRAAS